MFSKTSQKLKGLKGFTIVEVLVIISVIGILSTIGVISFQGAQKNTRDSQRVNQITIIAETLEKYYDKNGQYPDCSTLLGATGPLKGVDQKVLIAPKSNSASVACGGIPSASNDIFAYNFDLDTTGWNIEYFSEGQNTKKLAVSSRRARVTIAPIGAIVLTTPTLTATKNGQNAIDLTWGPYTPNNATGFIINYSTVSTFPVVSTQVKTLTSDILLYQLTSLTAGTKYYIRIKAVGDNVSFTDSAFSNVANATTDPDSYTMYASVTPAGSGTITGVANPYSAGSSASIKANDGSSYQFSYWENCSIATTATINITMSSDKTCVAHFIPIPVSTPVAPTMSVYQSGNYIYASINAVTCAVGTAEYSYRDRTNANAWNSYSGWFTAASGLSLTTKTAESGHFYSYQTKARCGATGAEGKNEATEYYAFTTPTKPVLYTPTKDTDDYYRYSWSNTCSDGPVSRYERYFKLNSISSPYDGSTSSPSGIEYSYSNAVLSTETIEGYTYTINVRSQCYIYSADGNSIYYSGWTDAINQIGHTIPVTPPSSIGVELAYTNPYASNQVRLLSMAICSSQKFVYQRTDYASTEYDPVGFPTQTSAWVGGDTWNGVWFNNTYTGGTILGIIQYTAILTTGSISTSSHWGIKVQPICRNADVSPVVEGISLEGNNYSPPYNPNYGNPIIYRCSSMQLIAKTKCNSSGDPNNFNQYW